MYTPEMTQAERELDARIDHALGVTRAVEAHVEELERQAKDEAPLPPWGVDGDVARLKAFVLGYARTPEWARVLDLIDEGELMWRQVLEAPSRAEVAAAFESMSRILPPTEEKLAEIFPAEPDPADAPESPSGGSGRRRIMAWPT